MSGWRSAAGAALAGGLALVPALAEACAVCGAAIERNRQAFLTTTILLSLLPLALIVAMVVLLRSRAGADWAGEFRERDAGRPDAIPPQRGGTGGHERGGGEEGGAVASRRARGGGPAGAGGGA